jgi:hypothetical protein
LLFDRGLRNDGVPYFFPRPEKKVARKFAGRKRLPIFAKQTTKQNDDESASDLSRFHSDEAHSFLPHGRKKRIRNQRKHGLGLRNGKAGIPEFLPLRNQKSRDAMRA